MNARAIGCGGIAIVVFIAVGLFGIWRASAPVECPGRLPYQPAAYAPVGAAVAQPTLTGVEGPLERAGSASFGLARWDVFVEPGLVPEASGELLPQRIVLDCGDGTFQAYQRGTG